MFHSAVGYLACHLFVKILKMLKYRVLLMGSAILRDYVPYSKLHRYNQKYTYPKLSFYTHIDTTKVWPYCTFMYFAYSA